jgi:hypothetical protein
MAYGNGGILSAAEARGKNTNSIMANWVDRGPWTYWDTAFFTNGVAIPDQVNFFAIPINSQNTQGVAGITGGLPKTKLMTNMVKSYEFKPPECLLLMRIGIQFSSNFLKPDVDKFLNSYWMELKIDDKIFHQGWLIDFPAGGGLSGVTENAAEATWVNGVPTPTFQRKYGDWAKYIAPQQFFSVTFFRGLTSGQTVPTLGTTDTTINYPGTIRVLLDGLTDRSVQ